MPKLTLMAAARQVQGEVPLCRKGVRVLVLVLLLEIGANRSRTRTRRRTRRSESHFGIAPRVIVRLNIPP